MSAEANIIQFRALELGLNFGFTTEELPDLDKSLNFLCFSFITFKLGIMAPTSKSGH